MAVGETVENVLAVAAAADEIGRAEDAEALRDSRKTVVVDFGYLRDTEFALSENREQTEPGRVTEGFEDADGPFKGGGGNGWGKSTATVFAGRAIGRIVLAGEDGHG